MKIDMENVFIGTIRVQATHCIFTSRGYIVYACEGEENVTSVLKENAILLKIKDGEYVDLDLLNNFLDEIKIKSQIIKNKIIKDSYFYSNRLIMKTYPNRLNIYFVDESTLKKYTYPNQTQKTTVKKLKKTRVDDVRHISSQDDIEW